MAGGATPFVAMPGIEQLLTTRNLAGAGLRLESLQLLLGAGVCRLCGHSQQEADQAHGGQQVFEKGGALHGSSWGCP